MAGGGEVSARNSKDSAAGLKGNCDGDRGAKLDALGKSDYHVLEVYQIGDRTIQQSDSCGPVFH